MDVRSIKTNARSDGNTFNFGADIGTQKEFWFVSVFILQAERIIGKELGGDQGWR